MIAAIYFTLLAAMSDQYLVGVWRLRWLACAGFLVYNWNPSHIFMGDAAASSWASCWRQWRSSCAFPATASPSHG